MVKHTYNNDFNALNDDFETIKLEIEKCIAAKVFATDKYSTLPTFCLKHLMIYEDCILEVTNEMRKKMNKGTQQSFNKSKQKIKKFLDEEGDVEYTYREQLKKYRENPPKEEEPPKVEKKKVAKKVEKPESSESEDEEEGEGEGEDSGSGSGSGSSSDSDSDSNSDKPQKASGKKKAEASQIKDQKDESSSSGSSSDDSGSSSDSESDSDDGDKVSGDDTDDDDKL